MAMAERPLSQTDSPRWFEMEANEPNDALSAFAGVRPRLFRIAYRVLGNAAEAEDIVQDVWLQWQSANRSAVDNPPAYLATTTTRLCINHTKSAHSRRQTYIGTWLQEPAAAGGDPGSNTERSEALKLAVAMLLERLSATERAAYILREAFDYSYRRIAQLLQMDEANTRQLVSRARKRILEGPGNPVRSGEEQRLMDAFITAAHQGDMGTLEGLFVEDVFCCADGGRTTRRRCSHVSDRGLMDIPLRYRGLTGAGIGVGAGPTIVETVDAR